MRKSQFISSKIVLVFFMITLQFSSLFWLPTASCRAQVVAPTDIVGTWSSDDGLVIIHFFADSRFVQESYTLASILPDFLQKYIPVKSAGRYVFEEENLIKLIFPVSNFVASCAANSGAAATGAKGDICSGTPCFGSGCLVMPEFYLIITGPNRMVEKTSVFLLSGLMDFSERVYHRE